MKVILLKDVKSLGKEGEIVNAKKKFDKAKEKEEYEKALELKKEIESINLELKSKAGEGGRLFGSITSKDIADLLESKHNIKIDRRKIELKENIKTLGNTQVSVRVYPEVVAKLNIKVIEE